LSSLEQLHCFNNSLTYLDVNGCTALSFLQAQNQTVEIDVPFNDNRTSTNIYFNGIAYRFTIGEGFAIKLPESISHRTSFSGTTSIFSVANR
jgi:hypothetical protein